ncbi:MAG: DUF2089 family protein [Pseudomonadota bacterium]
MNCPTCQTPMSVSELHCTGCNLSLRGQFGLPRLARLSKDNMKLAEDFILFGGNLKSIAEKMDISYPTLRRKVDDMIEELRSIQETDRRKADDILKNIEEGKMSAQEGLRLIREMNNT